MSRNPKDFAHDFPTELMGTLDPRLYRRLEQLYTLLYKLEQRQRELPSQIPAAINQQLQLLGVLREPLIGGEVADPQLVAAAQAPGTGTVTSVAATSSASGFGLTATPAPIVGTGTINFSISNAANARASLGIADPPLLASTVFDVNTNTKQTLYTVPGGKSAIITHIVFRNASTDLSVGGTTRLFLGFNAGSSDWGLTVALVSLTASTLFSVVSQEVITASLTSTIGTAAQTFGGLTDAAFGSAATVVIDVFGYTF